MISTTSSQYERAVSFREKSAWASLLTTIGVFLPYFVYIFGLFRRQELTAGTALGAFIGAVVFQTVLQVAVHIGISIWTREEEKDERDIAIESKAFRNAYLVLVSSCFVLIPCLIGFVLIPIGLGFGLDPKSAPRLVAPAFLSQLLLLCFIVAEITKYLTQVVCYRRGS